MTPAVPRALAVVLSLTLLVLDGSHASAERTSAAPEPALITAEVRAGYGLAIGGGAGRAAMRGSPLVLAVRAAAAFRDAPRLSGFGGLRIETLDRTGVGGEAGVVAEPSPRFRLRAGGVAMVAPYHLWGATVGGGRCARAGGTRLCLDLDADVMVGGSDLPDGGAVTQILLGLGVGFDVQ